MKSLKESLFDSDLVQKNIPVFGSMYDVERVNIKDDNYKYKGLISNDAEKEFKWLKNTIYLNKLKKDVKIPVKINNKLVKITQDEKRYDGWRAEEDFCNALGYLIAILNTCVINPDNEFTIDRVELFKKLEPYIKSRFSEAPIFYMGIDNKRVLQLFLNRGQIETIISFKKKR